jgi:signal transduction protein with GAF and PtsI domain
VTQPPAPTGDASRLDALAAVARERLGAAACSVALLQGDELVYVAAAGTGADQVRGMRLPAGRGVGGFVAVSGQALVLADVRSDPRHDRDAAARTGYLPTSLLAVPVEDPEGAVGVLTVLDRTVRPDDLETAAEVAAEVAGVLLGPGRDAVPGGDDPLAELRALVDRLALRAPADQRRAVRVLREVLAG